VGERRPGAPPMHTASADKFNRYTSEWKQFDLEDVVRHAWDWYVR
jgi:UDP-glucose 4-epimerase